MVILVYETSRPRPRVVFLALNMPAYSSAKKERRRVDRVLRYDPDWDEYELLAFLRASECEQLGPKALCT